MLSVFLRTLRRFRRDDRGVILVLFALLIVPLMLVLAVAIDFSQTLVVKRQLTAAVDAAALALAAMPSLDNEAADAKAEDYIRAHYPEGAIGRLKTFTVTREDNAVDVTVTAELDTAFLRVAGYDTLAVTVHNRVMRKQTKLEVVMVLDNTGSMAGTKIAALKTAAGTLVNILFGDQEEAEAVQIGLVPFANAVNIGSGNRGAIWMDEINPAAINGEHITDQNALISLFKVFDELKVSWRGCVRARTEPFDLTDAVPNPLNRDTLFTPYFAPDETLLSANDYILGDILPQMDISYYRGKTVNAAAPNYNCPQAIQPLTNLKSDITSSINAMKANGQTVIPEGMAWGLRLISPGPPFTSGAPYEDQDTIKAVIVLTDGDNDINPLTNGIYKSKFSAYGYAKDGHLGKADGSEADLFLNQKTSSVCANIKANKDEDASDQDVLLYTIVFGVGAGTATENMMRTCATDESKFFNSPTPEELQGAFESIALGLSKLRVAM